jgi:hypothetical protein
MCYWPVMYSMHVTSGNFKTLWNRKTDTGNYVEKYCAHQSGNKNSKYCVILSVTSVHKQFASFIFLFWIFLNSALRGTHSGFDEYSRLVEFVIVTDISGECNAFMFRVKQSTFLGIFDPKHKNISLKCWYQCLNCISDLGELYLDIKISYLTVIFWELLFAIPSTLYYIWILTAMIKHKRSQA